MQGESTEQFSIHTPYQEQNDAEQKQQGLGLKFWFAFWAIAVTNLAAAFDATMLSVALPVISESIEGSSIEAFWAGTSYLLASAIFMLTWVALSNGFGRRYVMLVALTIFAVGAIMCGVSQNFTVLIAGRTVQGLGGGGLIGLTTVIITDMVPLRDRGRFYAMISAVWAIGSTAGPIIGGALSQKGAWRWIFWINLPIVGVGFVGIAFFLTLSHKKRSLMEKLKEIDYVGSALFIASVTAFLIPVTWGGVQYAWGSWHTLVPLISGIIGLIAFGVYEVVVARNPLIPMSIFLNYSTSIVYMGSCFHGLILYALAYYMPEYFQAVQLYSPTISGVAALPQTTTIVPCAVVVGVVVGITGKYRWALWVGWVLATFGCGLLIKLDVDTGVAAWIFLAAVSGLGIGLLFPSIALAVQSSAPQTEVAMAATLVIFFRSFGQALGVAIGGTILSNRLEINLQNIPGLSQSSGQYAADAVSLVDKLQAMPKDSPLSVSLREAYAQSFQVIWAVMCGIGGLAMISHFMIKEYDMNQEHLTEQAFVREHLKSRETLMTEASRDTGEEQIPMETI